MRTGRWHIAEHRSRRSYFSGYLPLIEPRTLPRDAGHGATVEHGGRRVSRVHVVIWGGPSSFINGQDLKWWRRVNEHAPTLLPRAKENQGCVKRVAMLTRIHPVQSVLMSTGAKLPKTRFRPLCLRRHAGKGRARKGGLRGAVVPKKIGCDQSRPTSKLVATRSRPTSFCTRRACLTIVKSTNSLLNPERVLTEGGANGAWEEGRWPNSLLEYNSS